MLGLLTGAVAVAGLALLLGARRPLQTDPDFAEVAPQVFRHNFEMNVGIIIPVATFLLQLQQSSWVLVDTGAGSEQHCKSLIKGIKAKLGSADNKLRLILRELRLPRVHGLLGYAAWRQARCRCVSLPSHPHGTCAA